MSAYRLISIAAIVPFSAPPSFVSHPTCRFLDMEAMTLITQTDPSDEELVAMFGEAGITVSVVPNCRDASCVICFATVTATTDTVTAQAA